MVIFVVSGWTDRRLTSPALSPHKQYYYGLECSHPRRENDIVSRKSNKTQSYEIEGSEVHLLYNKRKKGLSAPQ